MVPVADECELCLEHAVRRRCCDGVFCDHCYQDKGACPKCNVKLQNGAPAPPAEEMAEGEAEASDTCAVLFCHWGRGGRSVTSPAHVAAGSRRDTRWM